MKKFRKVYKWCNPPKDGIMKTGNVLIALLASMLILSFAIILIKGDVLMPEQPPYVPPSSLSIRDVDVKPVEVTSAEIIANVTAYIDHNGGKTQNASCS